jgi:hypothetical protein
LFASFARPSWSTHVAAEGFDTDGYVLVDSAERGPADTSAGVKNGVIEAALQREFSPNASLFLAASVFNESRSNGTPMQINDTPIQEVSAGGNWESDNSGFFQMRLYGSAQTFRQDFSAISSDRKTETLIRSQEVPSQQAGFLGQWVKNLGSLHTLVGGTEAREVRGDSNEQTFIAGTANRWRGISHSMR